MDAPLCDAWFLICLIDSSVFKVIRKTEEIRKVICIEINIKS